MATKRMSKRTFTIEVTYDPDKVAGFGPALNSRLKAAVEEYDNQNNFHSVECNYAPSVPVEVELPPELDRDKLIKVVQWAAGEDAKKKLGLPSEWEQGYWLTYVGEDVGVGAGGFCGTACCIAGKVALDDGWQPLPDLNGYVGQTGASVVRGEGGDQEARSVGPLAREILGLDQDQADRLFAGDNTYEDVIRIAQEILGVEDEE